MSMERDPSEWPRLRREPSDADAHVRDLLPSYVNGTLAPVEFGRVGEHLARCPGCRAALRSWEAIARAVRASTPIRAMAGEPAVLAVVRALGEPDRPLDRPRPRRPAPVPDPAVGRPSPLGEEPFAPGAATRVPTTRPHVRRSRLAEAVAAAILVLVLVVLVIAL